METVKGSVFKVIFHNEESGFKVLKVRLTSGPIITVVGEFGPDIAPSTIADFHGDYKQHAKYGTNFKTASYSVSFNAGKLESIKLFLDHISPNIGPERAGLIVDHFGENIISILDNAPDKLTEIPGIGKISAESLREAWTQNREKWDKKQEEYTLRVFLNNLGIKERRVKKILNYFGGGSVAEETIKKEPYKLTEIEGFGFTTADFVARKLGIPESDPMRLRAYILYLLKAECANYGHLYLTRNEIVAFINKYAKDSGTMFINKQNIEETDIEEFILSLETNNLIIDDNNNVYAINTFLSESDSASKIVSILEKPSDLILLTRDTIDRHISVFEQIHSIKLSEEQKEALYYFAEKKVFVITGAPGTGKCLGYNTPVLMYDGTIKMVQNIVRGDILMGDDSKPRTVLNTSRGKEQMYKIIPNKGNSYTVNKSHILSLKESGGKNFEKGRIIDIPIQNYLKQNNNKKHHLKGYRVPVNFKFTEINIDPYLLGFWLGNGAKAGTRISTPFPEVIVYLSNIIREWGLSIKKVKGDNVDYDITCDRTSSIYKNLLDKRKPNLFLNYLREYNLLFNKHIPLQYKTNSRENRLKLLAGLIDSDGHLDRGHLYEVTFKSKSLAEDTAYVARSLGFSAYINPCEKKWDCVRKGKRYTGKGIYYRMHICGEIINIPCIVSKKKAKKRNQIKDVLVTGIKVESAGIKNYYGFEIDGNGRFLLGDFTVTHNTTILKAIVDLAMTLQLNLTCMTPTGISAKKMAETIQYDAYTIHRRLGFRGNIWMHGENNKYFTDIVIIDETSMVDQEVFYRLLAALEHRVHIIFVGDDNQLPSVGAGNVLRELINCGQIPVVRLEQIFRQDEASDIIKAAHKIKNGDTDLSLFVPDPKRDVFFIRENNTEIIESYVVKLAQRFKDERRIFQIITARNEGPLSVNELNNSLQSILNSGPEKEVNLKYFKIKRGDRVIVIKNDYEIEVFNGEIGKVIDIENNFITIQIDNRIIHISNEEASEKLKLAYSITVHRSQGQEYPYIILPFINQFGKNLLQRNLLYTAITRAKQKVIVIGHGGALEKAINNSSVYKRNTKLGERIRGCLHKERKTSFSRQLEEQVKSLTSTPKEEQF